MYWKQKFFDLISYSVSIGECLSCVTAARKVFLNLHEGDEAISRAFREACACAPLCVHLVVYSSHLRRFTCATAYIASSTNEGNMLRAVCLGAYMDHVGYSAAVRFPPGCVHVDLHHARVQPQGVRQPPAAAAIEHHET